MTPARLRDVLARRARAAGRSLIAEARLAALRACARRPYDLRSTVLLTGSPRSGTTWLGQLLATIPDSSVLFEPLHPDQVPAARRTGFNFRTYVAPGTDWPAGSRFIRRVLEGRVLNRWTTREVERFSTPAIWIVKCVRANRLLGWLAQEFPVRRPILLVRHPCAVVASQLAEGSWHQPWVEVDERLLDDHPHFRTVLKSVSTPEEVLAAMWALDIAVPLALPRPHPWRLVAYETLRRDPLGETRGIFADLGLPVPDGVAARVDVPSSTASAHLRAVRGAEAHRWQTELPGDVQRRILRVTHAFGLDFYAGDGIPDEAKLAAASN